MLIPIIQIGFNDDGEADFAIGYDIMNLDKAKMDRLRSMCMVALGVAEHMWKQAKQKDNPVKENKTGN